MHEIRFRATEFGGYGLARILLHKGASPTISQTACPVFLEKHTPRWPLSAAARAARSVRIKPGGVLRPSRYPPSSMAVLFPTCLSGPTLPRACAATCMPASARFPHVVQNAGALASSQVAGRDDVRSPWLSRPPYALPRRSLDSICPESGALPRNLLPPSVAATQGGDRRGRVHPRRWTSMRRRWTTMRRLKRHLSPPLTSPSPPPSSPTNARGAQLQVRCPIAACDPYPPRSCGAPPHESSRPFD